MRFHTILVLAILTLLFLAPRTQAQLGDAGDILRGGAEDANLLIENYLQPYASGFGAGLNSGWFNTAKPYGILGFDLRAGASFAFVPDADLFFDISDLTFQSLEHLGGPMESPTVAGDDTDGAILGQTYTYNHPLTGLPVTEELFSFTMPPGTDFPYVPAPIGQISVGLINDTEISLRFMPTINISDIGSVGLWGAGVKHGVNQWIPGGSILPVDISVQLGYTSLTADASLEVEPEIDGDTENPYRASTWDGQGIEMKSSGTTFNVLVGKSLPVLSVYGGVGLQSSTTTIATPGNYPLTVPNPDYPEKSNNTKRVESLESPIDLKLKGDNSAHALVGMRVRLTFLTFSASYTIAKYPVVNVGVGLSFR